MTTTQTAKVRISARIDNRTIDYCHNEGYMLNRFVNQALRTWFYDHDRERKDVTSLIDGSQYRPAAGTTAVQLRMERMFWSKAVWLSYNRNKLINQACEQYRKLDIEGKVPADIISYLKGDKS